MKLDEKSVIENPSLLFNSVALYLRLSTNNKNLFYSNFATLIVYDSTNDVKIKKFGCRSSTTIVYNCEPRASDGGNKLDFYFQVRSVASAGRKLMPRLRLHELSTIWQA